MITTPELEKLLASQYSLKCFINLSELSSSPTSAYKHFQHCYQEAFDNNDRLVLYTTDTISDKFLQHLYQASDLIDISNFFVLICSPFDISKEIVSAAEKYSISKSPYQTLQIEFEETAKLQNNFYISDTLCPMPWIHLEVSSQGVIRPCCIYSDGIGHVNDSSLSDAFYNTKMNDLRKDIQSGKKPSSCKNCWDLEDKGLISNRSYHLNLLKKELLTSDFDNPTIKSLDLKPGNTCNFKCRICNSGSSSLFAQEENKLKNISIQSFNWVSDSNTMDEIVNLLPSLTNIDLYGGEPFLLKQLTHLVSRAVENGYANNIRLHYNSNGSIYPDHLIEYWKSFKHVDIQFSIDNIGERFELERGGLWQHVDSNIRSLVELNLPNIKISIMPAISIMNIFYFNELLDWASNLNLKVNPLYVTTPEGFSLSNITDSAKKLIIEKFQNSPWPEMQNILNYVKTIPGTNGVEFVKLCKHFDSIRNQNFAKTHPEIAKAMGYSE